MEIDIFDLLKKFHSGVFTPKECFFCGSSKTINSHSIARSRVLQPLAEKGHVLAMGVENGPNFRMIRKGIKQKAGIFPGFCEDCDNKLFRRIDTEPYIIGDKEQEFLFAYRALAKEYFAKKAQLNFYTYLSEQVPNLPNINEVRLMLPDIRVGDKRLRELRVAFRLNLQRRKWHSLLSSTTLVNGEFPYAASSYIDLEKDADGNILNSTFAVITEEGLQRIGHLGIAVYFSLFPQDGKTFFILTYLKKEAGYFTWVDSLRVKNDQVIKEYFTGVLAFHVENFFVNPNYWERLPETLRTRFEEAFKKNIGLHNAGTTLETSMNIFI